MDCKKLATFSTIAFETGIKVFRKNYVNPLPTKNI